jgi:uncharacterized protein YqgV (UPF0045/DUF77 family)
MSILLFYIRRRSILELIAGWEPIINEAGLKHEMHIYWTNVEGEWDKMMATLIKYHEVVH